LAFDVEARLNLVRSRLDRHHDEPFAEQVEQRRTEARFEHVELVIVLSLPIQHTHDGVEAGEMDGVVYLNVVQAAEHGAIVLAQGYRLWVGPAEGVWDRSAEDMLSVADRSAWLMAVADDRKRWAARGDYATPRPRL
jgi:hypothetical protein